MKINFVTAETKQNARLTENGETKKYIGCTAGEFKLRYNGHKDSFRNDCKKTAHGFPHQLWRGSKIINQIQNGSLLERQASTSLEVGGSTSKKFNIIQAVKTKVT